MATKITIRSDEYGHTTIEAETPTGVIEVVVRRSVKLGRTVVEWPLLLTPTTEQASLVYDLLGRAIQIARALDDAADDLNEDNDDVYPEAQ